jgi:hypothetical protein
MDSNELVDIVKNAISNAQLYQSKLNNNILQMHGMSSPKVRHFLNNVISFKSRYLEIGCWRGSTFVSTLYKNSPEVAFAVDNWSEFNDSNMQLCNFDPIVGHPRDVFKQNVYKYLHCNINIVEGDCFQIDPHQYGIENINTFFYDGEHSFTSQQRALTYYYNYLAECFIFIVDDWTVPHIQEGTKDGIKESNLQVLYEYEGVPIKRQDVENWWEGLYISVLRKQ